MDAEDLLLTNILTQLNDIKSSLSDITSDVAVIKSEQANIKADLNEHKNKCNDKENGQTSNNTGSSKFVDIAKTWLFPVICSIFLLGRLSVEEPVKPINGMIKRDSSIDCTYVNTINTKNRINEKLLNAIIRK